MPLSKITNPFLDPAGSVNSNVYSPAANTLVMISAGVEKLRATSTGIGIGGLTPGAALDVNTNIYITETSASSSNTQLTMFSKFSDGQRGYVILKTESNSSGASDLVIRSRHNFNEAEKFRIDSVGRVTKPLQPTLHARLADSTVYAANAVFKPTTITVNIGNHFSGATGLFTAPVAGIYQLTASFLPSTSLSTSTYLSAEPLVNGTTRVSAYGAIYTASFGTEKGAAGTFLVSLAANDTLGLRLNGNGDIRLYSAESFMAIKLVG